MAHENNFYLGNGYDPLLQDSSNMDDLQARMKALQDRKQELLSIQGGQKSSQDQSIWNKIDDEIAPLTDAQKKVLFGDQEYQENEAQLMELVQSEMINLVRPRIEASQQGKQILDAQYKLVKSKKNAVIEEANKEIERFNAFKLASKANPELTYSEFIKQIGE